MRIVCLVPSLTETLFALGLTSNEVVGRTRWCIHPKKMRKEVLVVGGTKTPNLSKIRKLKPDLVVMDKEENPLSAYQTLIDEGFRIFVSDVTRPEDVPQMLRELGKACNRENAGQNLAAACQDSLDSINQNQPHITTIPLIWHNPLMAVSPAKYPGAILRKVGFDVVDIAPEGNGYPEVTIDDFIAHKIKLILLTSEPYNFSVEEGKIIAEKIVSAGGTAPEIVHIDGEDLTWFGARTATAITRLADFRAEVFKSLKQQ